MGINGLMTLIKANTANAVRKTNLSDYKGKVVACDAAVAMYQFLTATQFYRKEGLGKLTDLAGNQTGHLLGLFNRTLLFLEQDIKPVWVFDGKPPNEKSDELERRRKSKSEAQASLTAAQESGKTEDFLKFSQRTVTVTRNLSEDAKRMLTLMGVPVISAASEAEAQCADLVKRGLAYAVASEDLDVLPLGANRLVRGFTSKKDSLYEIQLEPLLQDLALPLPAFIDLCILCGCDYSDTIRGIGPITALKLLKQYHRIEDLLQYLANSATKYQVPVPFLYQEARKLFMNADVVSIEAKDLVWTQPNEVELYRYLVDEKGFARTRVDAGLKRGGSEKKEKLKKRKPETLK